MKTFHFIVQGRVQGVCFRYETKKTADRLGVKGTVKNQADGSVEVFCQGQETAVGEFENYLHRGPDPAHVDEVIKEVLDDENVFTNFAIIF